MPSPRSTTSALTPPDRLRRLGVDDAKDDRDADEREFASMEAMVRRLRSITGESADEPVDESDDEESDEDDTGREPHPRGGTHRPR